MSGRRLFSDAWHRVADLRVALRPTVRSHRQRFRGEVWYVLRDPMQNRFYRLRPEAWELVARLTPRQTVEETWLAELERNPGQAPGQEDVVELLSQLNRANLLYFDQAADAPRLYERRRAREGRELRGRLINLISPRVPLIDPDHLLARWSARLGWLFGWPGLVLWLGVLLSALVPLSERGGALLDQGAAVLSPGNLLWLYLAIALVKVLHELGHGLICRRFGGEVHTLGVMFIIFVPLPYVDATSSWALRSRYRRALVGAGGMLVELFLAAIAAWVWAYTAPGLVHSLAYNVMFVASVSTLLFNANPLLRFDGYYILSDLLDLPNLYQRSRHQLTYWFERYAAGCRQRPAPVESAREALWLSLYGVLSIAYRLLIFAGITLFVAEHYLLLGLLMALMMAFTTLVMPPVKLVQYLIDGPRLAGHRWRATAAASGLILLVLLPLGLIPVADHFRADGVVEALAYRELASEAEGFVARSHVPSGQRVEAGTLLVELDNPALLRQIEQARGELQEAELRVKQARSDAWTDLDPLQSRLTEAQARLAELERRHAALRITAPIGGLWIAPQQEHLSGAWVRRGAVLGRLVDDSAFRMSAVVRQEAASRLFEPGEQRVEVRLHGRAEQTIAVRDLAVVPYQHQQLPSAALGWMGGGDQPIKSGAEGGDGTLSSEPFFLVRARLLPAPGMPLWQGQSGVMRISAGHAPLLLQWQRDLRQLLQRRFLL